MKHRALEQTEKTKNFIKGVNILIDTGVVKNHATIIKALDWEKTMFSNVLNGRRNVPNDIYKKFTDVYKLIAGESKTYIKEDVPDYRDELIALLKYKVETLEKKVQELETAQHGRQSSG